MINNMYRLPIVLFLGVVSTAYSNSTPEEVTPKAPEAVAAENKAPAETEEFIPSGLQEKMLSLGFRIPKGRTEAPDFTLTSLTGTELNLSSYRGSIVFLNFWATWCGPCRAEMPSMETLYNKYKDSGLEIVAVNIRESSEKVQKFVTDLDLTFDVLLDTSGRIGSIYGARSIPTTYLLDREGTILGLIIGSREWDTAEVYEVFDEIVNAR